MATGWARPSCSPRNDHAEFIAERFNVNYPHQKGEFARVVTYKTVYAQSLIYAFSTKDKAPHIAISVDMLDTGIDVPEVVNLVFFKIVRSRAKFWQMLGRGTRLCPDLFGPGEHKKFFYLFDYCQNLEFFSQNPALVDGSTSESLSTRLFKARLDLIEELDQRVAGELIVSEALPIFGAAPGDEPNAQQLRDGTASLLHAIVSAMNTENFVVRPQRRVVEKFAQPAAWKWLGPDDRAELMNCAAGLPTGFVDTDEEAKRFDMLVLRTQLAILQARPGFGALRDQIRSIASALEEQEAVPAIKAEMALIQAIADDEWWGDVTVGMLENARKRLRALVKLIEKSRKNVTYTDFEDELGVETTIDLPEVANGLDMAKFKDKARLFLRAHEGHLALQRLRRGQPLTPMDLVELARKLGEAGGSPELIQKAAAENLGLGIFIRSLVGMEREAVSAAFSKVIAGTSATPDQIEFIGLIVDELTVTGVMDKARLYESPFLDVSPQGPEGLFPVSKVDEMVQVLEAIRRYAVA